MEGKPNKCKLAVEILPNNEVGVQVLTMWRFAMTMTWGCMSCIAAAS